MVTTIKNRVMFGLMQILVKVWRRCNREDEARIWSNRQLRKIAPYVSGDVINVSAGHDNDKESNTYKSYFPNAKSYSVSNYRKTLTGATSNEEVLLDLDEELLSASGLLGKYDAVFSHTVLEYVFHLDRAISNLCSMSRDLVVTVVPFVQSFHHEETVYHDYWRISPYALVGLFNKHLLKTIALGWNDDPVGNIYIFHVASRHPDRWNRIKELQGDITHAPGYSRQLLLSNIQSCKNVTISSGLIGV